MLLFKCARDYVEQFARDWSFERPHGGNDDADCQMQGTEKEISRRDFGIIYSKSTLEDYVQNLSRIISGKTTIQNCFRRLSTKKSKLSNLLLKEPFAVTFGKNIVSISTVMENHEKNMMIALFWLHISVVAIGEGFRYSHFSPMWMGSSTTRMGILASSRLVWGGRRWRRGQTALAKHFYQHFMLEKLQSSVLSFDS